jgi:hypothetical protein
MTLTFLDQFGMLAGIVIQLPRVYKLSVDVLEITPALLKAPANNLCLDIVSALGDPHSHSLYGQCFILKLKKNQVDAVSAARQEWFRKRSSRRCEHVG